MTVSFHTFELPEYQRKALEKAGIKEPTPIQEQAIPLILEGRDVVGKSRTGTGKTLAYLLPQLSKIDAQKRLLQVMILAPTRELTVQIEGAIRQYAEGSGIRSLALVGGANIERQIEKLKEKPHIIVGTPGRVKDILARKKMKVHEVKSVTIDEVDQMVELGFMQDVEAILKSLMRDRQLLFFSATMSDQAKKIAKDWMRDPVFLETEAGAMIGKIDHVFFTTGKDDKPDTLRRLVRAYNVNRAMVFVKEAKGLWWLVQEMRKLGISAEGLHGEAAKIQREQAMSGFRDGKFQLLITTDVGARGLDVEGVTHVFHYDPAIDPEHYLHRAGRTGRGTQSGVSVSIITPEEKFIIRKFEKALGIRIFAKGLEQGKIVTRRPGSAPKSAGRPAAKRKSKSAAGKRR
jgi:ATP-dependent RNA helicase DeaD